MNRPRAARPRRYAVVTALLSLAALTGCGGHDADSAGDAGRASKAAAAAITPSQVLASVPDPASITVPGAAPATTGATPKATQPPSGKTAGLTAQQIWDRANAAMNATTSVSFTMDTVDDQHVPLHITATLATDGDCTAKMAARAGSGQVIQVGAISYVKADVGMWKILLADPVFGDDLEKNVAGVWFGDELTHFAIPEISMACSISPVVQNVVQDFGGAKSKGAPKTVAGQLVIPVTQKSDDGSTTLDVAAEGPARVVRYTTSDPHPTTVTFTGYDKPLHTKAPAGAVT
ncbi:hypothetical protein [Actinacidiphila yeochonensis]|uniref:hypothetical protein n=1 Tax=Actinacidiphila yeochonensis TaxID=89050 RepID=UPI000562BCC2|nr:hypothetical protein [Actinacidiphila yeochonensis]